MELALESRRRVKEQLKKIAPHEFAKTSFSYVETDTARETFVEVPEQPETIDLSEAETLDETEESVIERGTELSIDELIMLSESQTLEFKTSMRRDPEGGGANKILEQVIVKSVAGLMNARGGVLLIGVADNGDVVGIEKDVALLPKRQDFDGYENHLTTLLEQGIGAAATANVDVRFETVADRTVCRVTVKPSSSTVWARLKGQEETLYVRLNNSTRPLGPREAHEYIRQHFG
jgi:ATP-dependent Lon protease